MPSAFECSRCGSVARRCQVKVWSAWIRAVQLTFPAKEDTPTFVDPMGPNMRAGQLVANMRMARVLQTAEIASHQFIYYKRFTDGSSQARALLGGGYASSLHLVPVLCKSSFFSLTQLLPAACRRSFARCSHAGTSAPRRGAFRSTSHTTGTAA